MRERKILWTNQLPPGEPIRSEVIEFPNQIAYQQDVLRLEMRGLLGMIVVRVEVTPTRPHIARQARTMFGGGLYDVEVVYRLPDLNKPGVWNDIIFGQQAREPHPEWISRGLSPEQAVAYEALKYLWEHEFKEGVLFNGTHVIDPDEDH